MEQGRLGLGLVLGEVPFCTPLRRRGGRRGRGLRAGSSLQGARGAASWPSLQL